MRRLLQTSQRLTQQNKQISRYYHESNCGRALMGSSQVQAPPKDYFKYHYVFEVYPDALSGFKHAPKDPFVGQHIFAYETWEFEYEGQWWDIGSLFSNIMYFTMPLWLFLIVYYDNKANAARRATKNQVYRVNGGFYHYQLYDVYEEPIIQEE